MLDQPAVIMEPPAPAMVTIQRAVVGCGCSIWVGVRLDTLEPATMSVACSEEHDFVVEHATMLLRESTVDPGDDPAVEVAESVLDQTLAFYGL
jgi:hypothetical protein